MTPTPEIMPGAEPWSAPGGPRGALVLHGFTGNPHSMRGVAHAMADAGFAVEMPLLPGHGTTVEDMLETGFDDWSTAVRETYRNLADHTESMVVVGLSMGGTLAAWLAAHEPEISGIVCINATVSAPEPMREMVKQLIDAGEVTTTGIGSDIAEPDVTELAYTETPLVPLLSLMDMAEEFEQLLPRITCPTLIIVSRNDHVVPPENSEKIASQISDSELVMIPGCGHGFLKQKTGEAIGHVLRFLEKVDG